MKIFLAIFLGIVQGVAEFLPISSSGHLSIFQGFFSLGELDDSHLLFDVMLHLGTFTSICISFRHELRQMFSDTMELVRGREDGAVQATPSVRMVVLIIIASLPLLIGIPFYGLLRRLFFTTGFIGVMLILTGALLYVSANYTVPRRNPKTERTLTIVDALLIGVAQLFALIPGFSRSGATISMGMARGADRDFAVRFSLLLSLPAVLGSAIVVFVSAIRTGIDWSVFPQYLLGFVVSGIVGVVSISFMRVLMAKEKWVNFAYYCFGVGALTIILSIIL